MSRQTDSGHGYTRLAATTVGAGAAELLSKVLVGLERGGDGAVSCRIVAVFDRTVHLALSTPDTNSALLAIGTKEIRRGPLMVQLDTPPGLSFERLVDNRTVSVTGQGGGGTGPAGIRFQLDRHVVLDIDGGTIPILPTPANRCRRIDLGWFAPGMDGPVVAEGLLDDLATAGVEDGLAKFEALRAYLGGQPGDDLEVLTSSIVAWLDADVGHPAGTKVGEHGRGSGSSTPALPDPIAALVGRGPGSTPAGDDFLAGLLLPLRTLDDEHVAHRAYELLCHVAGAARSESTTMSAALLRQAARGRAAQPVVDCLESIASPAAGTKTAYETATELLSVGHTSGSATLSGMLTTLTVVLPALAAGDGYLSN